MSRLCVNCKHYLYLNSSCLLAKKQSIELNSGKLINTPLVDSPMSYVSTLSKAQRQNAEAISSSSYDNNSTTRSSNDKSKNNQKINTIQHTLVKHNNLFDEQIHILDEQISTMKEIDAQQNPEIKAVLNRRLELLQLQEKKLAAGSKK